MSNFEFRGEGLSYFIHFLIVGFLTSITMGIYAPWGWCKTQKKVANDTYYKGRQLDFNGTGGSAFGLFIVQGLLIMITLGIYAAWAVVKINKWKAEHTTFIGGDPVA